MRLLSVQLSVSHEQYGRQQYDYQSDDTGHQQDEPRFGHELFDFLVIDDRVVVFAKRQTNNVTYEYIVVVTHGTCKLW